MSSITNGGSNDIRQDNSVSVVTVTFNSAAEIDDFYQSLLEQHVPWEVFFVDNASTDGTLEKLRAIEAADSRVNVIASPVNLGLAAGNNVPLQQLRNRYVAIINPDVVLEPAALDTLVRHLQRHQEVAVVGPLNVDQHGEPHSSFHRNWTLAHLLVWRVLPDRLTRQIYRLVRRYDRQSVLFVSGACLLTRTDLLRSIGGYDPEYFLTVEDVCDLCIRLSRSSGGKSVEVVPQARMLHHRARSASGVPLILLWQGARGSIYHFRKHHGVLAGWSAAFILAFSAAGRATVGTVLAPFGKRYRKSATNHFRVFRNIFRENPIALAARAAEPSRRAGPPDRTASRAGKISQGADC